MQRALPLESTNSSRVLLTNLFLLLLGLAIGWGLRAVLARPVHRFERPLPHRVDTPQFLREALEWCLRMSGAKRVLLWQIDRQKGRIVSIGAAGGPRAGELPLEGDPLVWAARQAVSLRLDPVPTWSDALQVFAVPVRTIDESDVVATFEVDEPTAMQPTQFDGLGVYLGGMMSVEGERATLGEQHARADDLIRTLRALPEATDAEALGQHLARAAIDMIDGSGCVVTVWEREVGTVVAAEGDAPAIGTTFGVSESETALAARAGATLLRERFARGALPIVASRERFAVAPKAVVAVPLKIRREVCGVLTAWSAHEIPQHGIHDLETLAPYAALQLRHAREFGVMRSLAQHDALTGMNNRLAFEEFMAAETARYDRYQRPFAVVMIDIDHFKSVNDRYGHEAGDAVLRRVSDVVRGSLRGVDFSARIGGEEFVMVLPETGLEEAIEIAERVRQRVEALTVEWGGQVMDIRVSAGVAAIPECVRFPNQLLRSADAALYASKRDGRNRVTASALGKR